MSVMNERPQRLTPSVGLTSQILVPAGPHPVRGELSAICRSKLDHEAARHEAVSTGHLGNDFRSDGRKKSYLHRITRPAPFGPGRCQGLTPKTTGSHRSGGQREP